jgi:release factor glutamine methyltransferase
MNNSSLSLQTRKIEEYRQLKEPYRKKLAGIEIIVTPNVYPGGTDSELLAETMDVTSGDTVLDLCTGTGIVALKAALTGAKRVIGTDLNPAAIANANENKKLHKLANLEFMETNLFPIPARQFDVVTINPPYTNNEAPDKTAICFWDKDNNVMKTFFERLGEYLALDGKAYVTWSSFADKTLLPALAKEHGFELRLVAERDGKSGFTYFVYKVERRAD